MGDYRDRAIDWGALVIMAVLIAGLAGSLFMLFARRPMHQPVVAVAASRHSLASSLYSSA
jgi:hypothetical protein